MNKTITDIDLIRTISKIYNEVMNTKYDCLDCMLDIISLPERRYRFPQPLYKTLKVNYPEVLTSFKALMNELKDRTNREAKAYIYQIADDASWFKINNRLPMYQKMRNSVTNVYDKINEELRQFVGCDDCSKHIAIEDDRPAWQVICDNASESLYDFEMLLRAEKRSERDSRKEDDESDEEKVVTDTPKKESKEDAKDMVNDCTCVNVFVGKDDVPRQRDIMEKTMVRRAMRLVKEMGGLVDKTYLQDQLTKTFENEYKKDTKDSKYDLAKLAIDELCKTTCLEWHNLVMTRAGYTRLVKIFTQIYSTKMAAAFGVDLDIGMNKLPNQWRSM